MLFKLSGRGLIRKQKTDKLRINAQFHVAFAPNRTVEVLPYCLTRISLRRFLAHYQKIMRVGHFFRAGIRDAKSSDLRAR